MSHTVSVYQLTHRCRGLQKKVAFQCDKCILMDNPGQKRHFCLIYAPLCILRYFYTQVCSRAIEVLRSLDRAVTFFFLHWQSRHFLAPAGCCVVVPPPHGWESGGLYVALPCYFPTRHPTMTTVTVLSWNIRGLQDPLKRTMVSSLLRKRLPAICALQETHLTADSLSCINFRWVGRAYHSTHTSYSRGVSVLVPGSIDFVELDSELDDEGRYVFLCCKLFSFKCILAFVYVPPPYNNLVLRSLVTFQMKYPETPLYVFGDFNNYTDAVLDKHPPVMGGGGVHRTALGKFIEEVGWRDPWRAKNPGVKQFSCFSKSYASLSRIDLCLCSSAAERHISEVTYALRSVSDHSPLIATLEVRPPSTMAKAPWKMNAFWLSLFPSHEQIESHIIDFWRLHEADDQWLVNWEAFKAVLRGLFITEIQAVKRKTHAQREGIENMAKELESKFITDPTQSNKEAWLSAQDALYKITTSTAERKRFFHKAAYYEEGEHTGRLLATIAHAHQTSPSIGALRTHLGGLTNAPDQILAELVEFYSSLYESKQTYTLDSLTEYLDNIQLPCLQMAAREELDAPLTVEELQLATSLFPNSKAPGDDGLPIEVYKQYGELILPRLLKVFDAAKQSGSLPQSMTRANIVLILKPNKDPLDPGSYRPISLLQTDVKILAKALAIRMNKVISSIIHSDQSGFMPQKSTAINLRRLFLNIQSQADNRGDRALLSLDAHKAFDSVEWDYLWAVMRKFGIGEDFIKWVQLLYSSPIAAIREGGRISSPFKLYRGTRQGCPLSPLLFAMAIEPLAATVRANPLIQGFKYGDIQEKVIMYADDTMLLLGDTSNSLTEAMSVIKQFGKYSGLVINWTKSSLLLLDRDPPTTQQNMQDIPVSTSFKYLGIQITAHILDYVNLNLTPLINRCRDRVKVWSKLKLSQVGRINLIKMILMPQLLYVLHNSPMVITLKKFRIINSLFRSFIWLSKPPRIKLEQLQRPKDNGGLALPNPWVYYLASQLQHIARAIGPGEDLELNLRDPSAHILRFTSRREVADGLEALQYNKSNKLFPTYALMQKIWNKVRMLQGVEGFTRYSPIWENNHYSEIAKIPYGPKWQQYGVSHMVHIIGDGKLRPFSELREAFQLPGSMLFYYRQLKHAIDAQRGPDIWNLQPTPIFNHLLAITTYRGFISDCYTMLLNLFLGDAPLRVVSHWEQDVGSFEEEQWEEALLAVSTCSLNAAQKLSQLYIISRVHYTPARLARMGLGTDPTCTRCSRDHGDLIHLLWRCPKLHLYWNEVINTINRVFQIVIPLDPKPCLLGIVDDLLTEDILRQAIRRALFQARLLILRHWRSTCPPTVQEWITQMGATIRMEKIIYQHRGATQKYEKLWAPWLDTPGLAPIDLIYDRLF